jgi:hypothetical protein
MKSDFLSFLACAVQCNCQYKILKKSFSPNFSVIFRYGSNKSANSAGNLHFPNKVTNSVRFITTDLNCLTSSSTENYGKQEIFYKAYSKRTCAVKPQSMKWGSACSGNRNTLSKVLKELGSRAMYFRTSLYCTTVF